jgi:hypothetical protein
MGLEGPHIVYICYHLEESAEVFRVFVLNLIYALAVQW